MFTDIAGSTELREQLGEIVYERHREAHDQTVRDLVESENAGAVVKSTGDGALAVFAEPSSAVLKALAIQSAIASDDYFRLRIGIDMGQVSLSSKGGIIADVFGRQVNRAARIQSLAESQHVLASFHVFDCAVGWLIGTPIKWHNHGKTTLKGFAETVSIHEPYDSQNLLPQAMPMPADPEGSGPVKSFQRESAVRSIRIRPVECVPVQSPLSFYGQAISLMVARLSELRPDPPTLLWVDDCPENNIREREILGAAGCRFDLAMSTSEAVQKITSRQYDVMITDMGRGSNPMAGIELLQWARNHNVHTPAIVYCSSRTVSLYGEEAISNSALLCTAGMISLLDGILQVLEQSWYFA
jgi:class 3 adenylate cyclase